MGGVDVLAIIPARSGSKGIPHKNFEELAGISPLQRAMDVCQATPDVSRVVVSSDIVLEWRANGDDPPNRPFSQVHRPPGLAQDDTPMIDVVQHVLETIPGPPDQIVLLVQPTQPLRTPAHLQEAITRLSGGMDYDSVVSLTPIPRTHAPESVVRYDDTCLEVYAFQPDGWGQRPTRRQAVQWPYICDGTVYAFWRKTVTTYGNIFGERVGPVMMDPSETCALDTPDDWIEAERRLCARDG